jgi:hypothetical protein
LCRGFGERNIQGIEVKGRGGVQAHWRVGSLKLLQDLHTSHKEFSDPPPPRFFIFIFLLANSPIDELPTRGVLFL